MQNFGRTPGHGPGGPGCASAPGHHAEEGLHHLQLAADELHLVRDPDEARDLVEDGRSGAAQDAVQHGPRQAQRRRFHPALCFVPASCRWMLVLPM